jgi:hypothetical protein
MFQEEFDAAGHKLFAAVEPDEWRPCVDHLRHLTSSINGKIKKKNSPQGKPPNEKIKITKKKGSCLNAIDHDWGEEEEEEKKITR